MDFRGVTCQQEVDVGMEKWKGHFTEVWSGCVNGEPRS